MNHLYESEDNISEDNFGIENITDSDSESVESFTHHVNCESFVGVPIHQMQQEFRDMSRSVIYGLTRPVPDMFKYSVRKNIDLESMYEQLTTEEKTRFIAERQRWVGRLYIPMGCSQKCQHYRRNEAHLDFIKKVIEFGQSNYLTDMEIKDIFFKALLSRAKGDLIMHQVNPLGKYGRYLTAERLFFISYIINSPLEGRPAAEQEYLNFKQGAEQPLKNYLGIKTQLYEKVFEAYGIEDYEHYKNTLINGIYDAKLRSHMMRQHNMLKGSCFSKAELFEAILVGASYYHCKAPNDNITLRPHNISQMNKLKVGCRAKYFQGSGNTDSDHRKQSTRRPGSIARQVKKEHAEAPEQTVWDRPLAQDKNGSLGPEES